jgi:hypothetical protein
MSYFGGGPKNGRLAALECFAFHLHVDLDVLAGCRDADMPEPGADDIEFDTSLEELHCRGVEGVGADSFSFQRRSLLGGCVAVSLNDDVDTITGNALASGVNK